MKRAWFVTGTDTEVGKTFASCSLLHAARRQGLSAVGMKPVAAGTGPESRNEDVARLVAASGFSAPESLINPWCFRAAIAPHLAAEAEGKVIGFAPILRACERLRTAADVVVVEGVGGFRVPLGPDGDSADLAVALGLPIILVVGLRLGCLNHALLTAEAIAARHLPLAGWIANTLDPTMERSAENVATLSGLLPAPCLGILPFRPDGDSAASAASLTLPSA